MAKDDELLNDELQDAAELEEQESLDGAEAGDEADAHDSSFDDDIDTPADEALLYGPDEDEEDDADALAAIAGEAEDEDGGEDEGESEAEDSPRAPEIPSSRVSEVIEQIRDMHDRLGMAAPDFGEAVAMSQEDFADLVTMRNRMKIKVAASSIDLDAEPTPKQQADAATDDNQGEQTDTDTTLEELERQYLDAQYEGDTDKALEIRRQIRAEERRIAEESAQRKAEELVQRKEAENSVRDVAAQALKAYPFLGENNGKNDAMNEVIEWREFYEAKGESRAQALAKAVNKVAPQYAPAQAPAAPTKPVQTDKRKEAAAQRNAEVTRAQPPAMDAGVGNRAVPPGPRVETQEDWERLPESERQRLLM